MKPRRGQWLLISLLVLMCVSGGAVTPDTQHSARAAEPRPTLVPPPTVGPPRPTLTPPPEPTRPPGEPAAVCLRLDADPNRSATAGSLVRYRLTAESQGAGTARRLRVTLSFDPAAQTLLDASFSTPAAWVSELSPGEGIISIDALRQGDSLQATLLMLVRSGQPAGRPVITGASARWSDDAGGGSARSNQIALVVAEQPGSGDIGALTIDPPAGDRSTVFTVSAGGFAPGEEVAHWYHDGRGRTIALERVRADADGIALFTLPAAGLTLGDTQLVAYGPCSQVTASGTLRVVDNSSSVTDK